MTRKPDTEPAASSKNPSPAGEASAVAEPASAKPNPAARAAREREDRLAAALRTNLARRKAAARAASEGDADDPSE